VAAVRRADVHDHKVEELTEVLRLIEVRSEDGIMVSGRQSPGRLSIPRCAKRPVDHSVLGTSDEGRVDLALRGDG